MLTKHYGKISSFLWMLYIFLFYWDCVRAGSIEMFCSIDWNWWGPSEICANTLIALYVLDYFNLPPFKKLISDR